MSNKINLYCCSTKYHILLSSLIAYQNKDDTNILFVEVTGFSGKENLSKEYDFPFFTEVVILENAGKRLKRKTDYIGYKNNIRNQLERDYPQLRKYRLLEQQANDTICCYICEDGHHFSRYFVYNFHNVIMLEEGMQIYKPIVRRESKAKQIFKYNILGIIRPNGLDRRIKEIWVQYPDRLPEGIVDKGRKLDLKRLMDCIVDTPYLSTLEDMLGFTDEILQQVRGVLNGKSDTQKVLLITQPFSEDGLIDENEKKNIYLKMIATLSFHHILIIKPHPREKTDYEKVFPDSIILENGFPLEMIRFICDSGDQPIDYALTVDSTAVMNIQELCKTVKMFGLCEITEKLNQKYPMEKLYENKIN